MIRAVTRINFKIRESGSPGREERIRRGERKAKCLPRIVVVLVLLLLPANLSAQELTPGAYWPLPNGVNILTLVNSFNWGDVTFDPSLPVEDAHARINTTAVAYTRGLSVAGRSANVTIQLPIVAGHLDGVYAGVPTTLDRFGLGDPRVAFGINVYGAPAMTPRAHAAFKMRTLVGVSLTVAPPLGQYDDTKVINLGSNRWSVKPEIGLSRAWGHWVAETMAGVWLFTDNTDFAGGKTRSQDPIPSIQGHLTYRFSQRVWLAGDANFYYGGRTSVGTVAQVDLQKNSRVGSTFSWGLDSHNAIRASISRGAYTTIGADFVAIAVGYNYGWLQ